MDGEKLGKGGHGNQPYDKDGKYTKDRGGNTSTPVSSSPVKNNLGSWFFSKVKSASQNNSPRESAGRYDDYDNLVGDFTFTLVNFKKNREKRAKDGRFGFGIDPYSPVAKTINDNPEVRTHIEDILRDNSAYCTNCDHAYVLDIIENGLKNQFAFIDDDHTGGSTSKSGRARWSKKMFGTDIGDDPEEFYSHHDYGETYEKYGCLLQKDPLERLDNSAHSYGDSIIEFKPEIRKRTTYTFGDSLGTTCAPQLIGGKLDNGVFCDSYINHPSRDDIMKWKTPADITKGYDLSYIEAQYHGKVDGSDIDNITMRMRHWSSDEGKLVLQACKKYGIKAYTSYIDPETRKKRLGIADLDEKDNVVFHDSETGKLIS